jgi:hypothetical protein
VAGKSVFGRISDDEEMQERLREGRRRAADAERARRKALTPEQRVWKAAHKLLTEGLKPPKLPALKPHPWQAGARERRKKKADS